MKLPVDATAQTTAATAVPFQDAEVTSSPPESGTRISVPRETIVNGETSVLSGELETETDRVFERETTMTASAGKSRKWQNVPTQEQVEAYRKARTGAAPPVEVDSTGAGGGMPVLDTSGLTQIK